MHIKNHWVQISFTKKMKLYDSVSFRLWLSIIYIFWHTFFSLCIFDHFFPLFYLIFSFNVTIHLFFFFIWWPLILVQHILFVHTILLFLSLFSQSSLDSMVVQCASSTVLVHLQPAPSLAIQLPTMVWDCFSVIYHLQNRLLFYKFFILNYLPCLPLFEWVYLLLLRSHTACFHSSFFSSFSTSSSCNFFLCIWTSYFVYIYKSLWLISSVLFDL